MKKTLWVKIIAGVVATYALLGFMAVPYAIENIVPEKVSEATGGGILSIERASFNPFTFRLSIEKIAFKTPKREKFVNVGKFVINVNPIDYLWKFRLVISELKIENPFVHVHKDEAGEMNFAWLLDSDEKNTTKETSEPAPLLIRDFTLRGGSVEYYDESEGKNFSQSIDDLGFHLESIDLRAASSAKGLMRLYASINDGGFVDFRGKISGMKPFAMQGSFAFDSGKLYTPWKYFKEKLPIEVADGKAALRLDYALNTSDMNATKLSHVNVSLNGLKVIDKESKAPLIYLDNFKLNDASVLPLQKVFTAPSIALKGLGFNATRSHSGVVNWDNYLEKINTAFPDDDNETKEPWKAKISTLSLDDIQLGWKDNAPADPYTATIKGIGVHFFDIDSNPAEPLKGSLSIGELDIVSSKKGKIGGFENIDVDGIVLQRENKYAGIDSISINGVNLSLKREKNGQIDLKDLIYVSNKPTEKSEKSEPWSYSIEKIALNDTRVSARDDVPYKSVDFLIDRLFLGIKGFSSDTKRPLDIDLSGRLNEQTDIKASAKVSLSSLGAKGNFVLAKFSVPLIDPYIEPSTYAMLKRGLLSVSGTFDHSAKKSAVEGKIALNDWVVEDRRDGSLLVGWNRIGVTPFVYGYPDNRLKINQIAVDSLYVNTLIDYNKTLNFSSLSKSKASESNVSAEPSANPFGIDIVRLVMLNSSATFSDLSLPLPFKTYIHDLAGEVLGISTTKDVVTLVKLKGGVDEYGSASINGSLNTKAPKSFTDMKVVFENLALKDYTPYSLEFMGYKIDNGKLFLDLGYKITEGKLDGKNSVVIKRIELGEEKAGGSPWPLRLVVALLEDSDGVIDIDLPVQGDVNDPDFKYGKVIWQMIGNLLTKAVTSPFKLLGSLMGMDSDDESLSNIAFEPGEDTLLPAEREKLDRLASVLQKRPKLSLKVHGGWASQEDERALRLQKLINFVTGKTAQKRNEATEAMSLEMLEASAKKTLPAGDVKTLRNEHEKRYPQEGEFTRRYMDALIEKLIVLQVLPSAEVDALAQRRAKTIVEYLSKNVELIKKVSIAPIQKAQANSDSLVPSSLEVGVQ